MVTLMTLKQEVRGLNPGAAPPKFGAHTPPYTTPSPGHKDVSRVPERDGVRESRAPGMTKKSYLFYLFLTGSPSCPTCTRRRRSGS